MPAIKKSEILQKLQGTYRPDREIKKAPPVVPIEKLGPPPKHLSGPEKAVWKEIAAKLPDNIASPADSLAFEVLVKLMCRFRTDGLTGTEITLLMRSFAKFGLTPQDRSSIEPIPVPKGPSKWDQFRT